MTTYAQREKRAQAEVDKFKNCEHKNIQDFTECCLDCRHNIYSTPDEIFKKEMSHGW